MWRKKVGRAPYSFYQIQHTQCHVTLHINDCLYPSEYTSKQTIQPLFWLFLLLIAVVERRKGGRNQGHGSKRSAAQWIPRPHPKYPCTLVQGMSGWWDAFVAYMQGAEKILYVTTFYTCSQYLTFLCAGAKTSSLLQYNQLSSYQSNSLNWI